MLRRLPAALLPPATVLAATAIGLAVPTIARSWLPLQDVVLGAALGIGVLLAVQFGRSRVALGILMLGAVDVGLRAWPAPEARAVLASVVPLCLVGLAVLQERGLASPAGVLRLLLTALPVAALAFALPGEASLPALPARVALTFAGLVLVTRAAGRASPLDGGFLGAVAAAAVAFWPRLPPELVHAWLTAAILALAVAVVQEGQRMAYVDELTGIPGRRAFNEHLLRLGRRYAIAVVDVDHFKRFNDTHGHDLGDRVLQMVAAQLERVGGGGRAFRCGGEEFAIVFAGRSAAEARPHLEALRRKVEGARVRLPRRARVAVAGALSVLRLSEPLPWASVTMSVGVAEPEDGRRTPEEVIAAADQALYQAKDAGRNRVCSAGEPSAAPAGAAALA